jgi:hypothetical protein
MGSSIGAMTPMLLLALGLLQAPPAPAPDRTYPRVRPDDRCARTMIWDGIQSSPTVARLVASIEASDVVVYVRCGAGLRHKGLLTFVAHGGPLTYVLIRVEIGQLEIDRVATLAHELTHAVEVAEARPSLHTEAELQALYRRIGMPGERPGEFESRTAVANERQARTELWHVDATPPKALRR